MKRIQEKVKDLVEVRPYKSLAEYLSDPPQTLSAYHFTDATSDMMAKWLDVVSDLQENSGAAKALAGYRGVGKSHFLATLGAVVSHPELRSRISESHVAASAQRLKRKRYPVAYVRRGTGTTLLEEIREAIAEAFEIDKALLANELPGILSAAMEKCGELPLIMLVDTARDRENRVSRDDGTLLGELAVHIKGLNAFVGVALDDDIAGADGANAAIAKNYTIDYLDQEHLYRIVETHLFPKHRQSLHMLHDIYTGFREVMPSFRWSEQRFTSLYPLHPVIMEIAPFIRLYAKDFAMLGFASEAGSKVQGRPANSLVALDEVFDRVETSLRKATDLEEAFETYDQINNQVIGKIPIMQRLQAKLVLKGLMLLSLDGDGTTAAEISAAMLIYNESDPKSSLKSVEEILESFGSALPDKVHRISEEGRETRYSLKVSSKDNLNGVLSQLAESVSADVIEPILRRYAKERFADWALLDETDGSNLDSSDCQVVWRGGQRRGKIYWNFNSAAAENDAAEKSSDHLDWEVKVLPAGQAVPGESDSSQVPVVSWIPASLKKEEEEVIFRYHVLLTDESLKETFAEQVRAAGHTHKSAIRKIWNRIFLQEASFVIGQTPYAFTETGQAAQTLSDMLSEMLVPLFEGRYPEHPEFAGTLGMNEVSRLVSEHFSGQKQMLPEVQELAEAYALPLGLVVNHGGNYILNSGEDLLEHPYIKQVMDMAAAGGSNMISTKSIYPKLKQSPYGLGREAQHLVLAALVALRHLEFVTSKGDRINRRSLDLKIIWDDIVGVALPSVGIYASTELLKWAQILTGTEGIKSIENEDDSDRITEALTKWIENWKQKRILDRFDELPDEILNIKIWRLAMNAKKTFGVVAHTVESVLDNSISLGEGLQRMADVFSDSEEAFVTGTKELVSLEDYISGYAKREKLWEYLALSDITQQEDIEITRQNLLQSLEEVALNPNQAANRQMEELWESFSSKFTEHFAIRHDTVMKSHHLQEKLDEIMRSDEWWEFKRLSELPIFYKHHWDQAQKVCKSVKQLDCGFDVRDSLKRVPSCVCSFRISEADRWETLPQTLHRTVSEGRAGYRKTLAILGKNLLPLLDQFAEKHCQDPELKEAAAKLRAKAEKGFGGETLTNAELTVLDHVLRQVPSSTVIGINLQSNLGNLNREELRSALTDRVNVLPGDPVLLKC